MRRTHEAELSPLNVCSVKIGSSVSHRKRLEKPLPIFTRKSTRRGAGYWIQKRNAVTVQLLRNTRLSHASHNSVLPQRTADNPAFSPFRSPLNDLNKRASPRIISFALCGLHGFFRLLFLHINIVYTNCQGLARDRCKTQFSSSPRTRGSSNTNKSWIPASAGMTAENDLGVLQ